MIAGAAAISSTPAFSIGDRIYAADEIDLRMPHGR